MNAKTLKAITRARAAYKAAWAKACKADGIDPASTFVVLSKNNRHEPELNRAAKKLQSFFQKKA
jgi:hypothetical protein